MFYFYFFLILFLEIRISGRFLNSNTKQRHIRLVGGRLVRRLQTTIYNVISFRKLLNEQIQHFLTDNEIQQSHEIL